MIFEDLEISEQEYDEFIAGWDLDKLKQDQPYAHRAIIKSIKRRITEARLDALADIKVACLQKWCGVAMGILGDKMEPDLTRPLPTKEDVNGFKDRVKNFFKKELYDGETVKPHWLEQGIDQLPPWDNLSESSWLSFYREYRKI